ncbi:MAG: hypothetical protein WC091_02695 [Sulfuricellaceae bacterium]
MQRSLPFDAQRTINLFPIMDQFGKEPASLLGTPGKLLLGTTGVGSGRGCYRASNGRGFTVTGGTLYEVFSNGVSTSRGSLPTASGLVQMADNGFQLAVCDGVNLFMFTFATNTFEQITGGAQYVTDGTFPAATAAWTLGANWTLYTGYAFGNNASSDLSQTAASSLIAGKRYTVTYKIGGIQYVTNGTFDTNTGWTLGAGWTITTGAARRTVAGSDDISQTAANTLVNGENYIFTMTVSRTSGNLAVTLGGGAAGATITTSGTITQTLTAGATQIININATSFVGSIDNVSVTNETTGDIVFDLGGTLGVPRTAPGEYVETLVAGATQTIKFTGTAFTGTVSEVSVKDISAGFTSAATITFIDGYFVISETPTSGIFRISGLYDGFTWASLQFATAESSPDNLLKVTNVNGQLWLSGTETTEIWANTGALSFPFQRVSGAKIEHGVLSANSGLALDSSFFWVASSRFGKGIVYRADGFSPQRISTETIERIIQDAPDPSTIKIFAYEDDGHTFLAVTGGGMDTSFYYDLATSLWHERAYLNEFGEFEQETAIDMMFFAGIQVVIDRENGNFYHQSHDYFTDNGDLIARERTFTHIFDENKRMLYRNLTVGFETGVGNQSNPGQDPTATLYISNDGAKTWSGGYMRSIGKVGEYLKRVIFWQLGQTRQRTFRIRIAEPVKVAITGAWFNA